MAGTLRGTTGRLLFTFTVSFCGAPKDTPKGDPTVVRGIRLNSQIGKMKKSIEELEPERANTFSMESQVSKLAPNIEANTLLKPETKNQLIIRITNLLDLIKQGISIDANLAALDTQASELKKQLFAALRAYFSKKQADVSQTAAENTTLANTIEDRAKETDRLTRSFRSLYRQLTGAYTEAREKLPGTGPLNLKPLNTFATTTSGVDAEKQTPRLEK